MEKIKQKLNFLFKSKLYDQNDVIDETVWFLRENIVYSNNNSMIVNNLNNDSTISTLFQETPSENEDLVKFVFLLLFHQKNKKIFVKDFIEEICENIGIIKNETKRLDNLIEKYKAYETKNHIELLLKNPETFTKNNFLVKSDLKMSLNSLHNFPRGEYKKMLIVSSFTDRNKNTFEEIVEFNLNFLLKIKEKSKNLEFTDFFFPKIDFYSFDPIEPNKMETGTNLNYFQILIENIEKPEEKTIYSEKIYFIDIFLSNMKTFLNYSKVNKEIFHLIDFGEENFQIDLKIEMEIDPITLSAIYMKYATLLKNIISYKVSVEHKLKTISSYFPEIEEELNDYIVNENKKNQKCFIF